MKKLFIHIGMPKTGSSSIQKWLSSNAENLVLRDGLFYADLVPSAKNGRITSGNAKWLCEVFQMMRGNGSFPADFSQLFYELYINGHSKALISSESLARTSRDALLEFRSHLDRLGVQVEIIAYIRNIYDHAWSAYQQIVKRGGYFYDFPEFAKDYANPQVRYIRVWSECFPKFTLIHYDVAKGDLTNSFCNALGISAKSYASTSGGLNVNRSLTRRELKMLLHLNEQAKNHGFEFKGALSDALIYSQPNAKSFFKYDDAIIDGYKTRFAGDLDWVHEHFPSCASWCVTNATASIDASLDDLDISADIMVVFNALCDRIAFYQRRAAG